MRIIGALIIAILSQPLHADALKLDSERDRMSYSLGHQLGSTFKRQATDVDPESLRHGMQDALAGNTPRMSEQEMELARAELRRLSQTALRAQAEKVARTKRAAGLVFLEENKRKADVKVTPSGLQYRVIKAGEGKTPGPRDKVSVHYRGTLIDGSEFDSSHRRNQPASFPLNGVIAGWTEGLQLMREGAKYELVLPPALAYGEQGRLANETLIFEVELLAVEAAARQGE